MGNHVAANYARDLDPNRKWRYRCPSCGSPCIERRYPNSIRSTATHRYYCNSCHEHFDEPLDKLEDE